MPFNSLKYLFFLPAVCLLFHATAPRARWGVLLAASLAFYASLGAPYLLAVLGGVAAVTYGCALAIDRAESPRAKKLLLYCGIAGNVSILALMKYLPFFCQNLESLSSLLSLDLRLEPVTVWVTIGISYFIFQALSYLFDVYLEIEKPERHFGIFSLYLSFFPKLLQGPIERASDLIPQLRSRSAFDYESVRHGLLLIGWGLFKKVVIADRLGVYADTVYNDVSSFSGIPLVIGTYAYAMQIYLDFSGYTDIALGSARLFNINLTQNFNSPYFATSVADFWRRWHITFSRWILDYIFKPLQMKWRDAGNLGTAAALLAAFLVSGIWHGASWGFVVWGGLHGLYLASSVLYKPYQKKLHKMVDAKNSRIIKLGQMVVTFNLVCFAWIFFRAKTAPEAIHVVTHLFGKAKGMGKLLQAQGNTDLLLVVSFLLLTLLIEASGNIEAVDRRLCRKTVWVRWPAYYLLLILLVLFHVESGRSFAYFQF
jgi:alginate O-acetyltransferase complex protein AlgI